MRNLQQQLLSEQAAVKRFSTRGSSKRASSPSYEQHCPALAPALLSEAPSFYRRLHPSCHAEVKPIYPPRTSRAGAFLFTSVTQVVRLHRRAVGERECLQGMLLGARSGTAPEFYGFIIPAHKLSPSRAPFHLPVFIILQLEFHSKSLKG